ncbi:NUDIX hydrolase [Ferroplasma sp.]|uniref:NUDIX hydrolase n=1 Tax=Ferroplasma sp. TaxID=2591003 RepID=UPI00307CF6AF
MKRYPKIAIGGIIIKDNKILLGKRRDEPDRGKWAIPGGKLELNETLEEGLKREMLEETGLIVNVGELAGISEIITENFHYIIMDYICIREEGSEKAGSDTLELKYFDMQAMDEKINESTKDFISKMLKSKIPIHVIKKYINK